MTDITNLISPTKTAEILGIKPETLAIWRCQKRYNLPYIRAGRLIRYRREDIEAFIASRLVQEVAQ